MAHPQSGPEAASILPLLVDRAPWPQAWRPHIPGQKIAILQFRERQIARARLEFWAGLHGRRKLVGQIKLGVRGWYFDHGISLPAGG